MSSAAPLLPVYFTADDAFTAAVGGSIVDVIHNEEGNDRCIAGDRNDKRNETVTLTKTSKINIILIAAWNKDDG